MSHSADHARVFRDLHQNAILLLANAWDAGSAKLIEKQGAKAIATTSAGVAWSLGYPDGDSLPLAKLADAVANIARVLQIPLTTDMESGYSDDPAVVADNALRLIEAGAVGINLEDGSGTPALLCAKIEAIKNAAAKAGAELFVNARTDVYLAGLAPEPRRIEETLSRGRSYRDAGADGFFVPGVAAEADIRAIAAGVDLPLNVMTRPALPDADTLKNWGVRRLSAGPYLTASSYARVAALSKRFLADGLSAPLAEDAMAYSEINAWFPG